MTLNTLIIGLVLWLVVSILVIVYRAYKQTQLSDRVNQMIYIKSMRESSSTSSLVSKASQRSIDIMTLEKMDYAARTEALVYSWTLLRFFSSTRKKPHDPLVRLNSDYRKEIESRLNKLK